MNFILLKDVLLGQDALNRLRSWIEGIGLTVVVQTLPAAGKTCVEIVIDDSDNNLAEVTMAHRVVAQLKSEGWREEAP